MTFSSLAWEDVMARIVGTLIGALWAISIAAAGEGTARACGCFAPPDPVTSIVQAGERIVFSVENGQVTAHIQIQYSGDAKDFGWLLPLPSVPTLEIGAEELFATLDQRTAPRYVQEQRFPAFCNWPAPPAPIGWGGGADLGQSAASDMISSPPPDGMSPLVVQDSIGPYDFAVLKADDKTAMLAWLAQNRYLVPTGTDSVLTPYIHPGPTSSRSS